MTLASLNKDKNWLWVKAYIGPKSVFFGMVTHPALVFFSKVCWVVNGVITRVLTHSQLRRDSRGFPRLRPTRLFVS